MSGTFRASAPLQLIRHNPEFRRLFLAHSISRAGDAFNTIALLVLVFDLTGTGLGVAATVAFEALPVILLGPVVGVIVDRYPRRSLMVGADLVRAGLALLVALVSDSVALAYGVAFGLSALAQVFNPAASATLPDVVAADDLVDANAALWTVAVLAQIALAPLAGLVVATWGFGPAFAANALSYTLSAALLGGLAAGRSPAAAPARDWRVVAEGLHVVRPHPLLARLAVVQVLAALSAGATGGLLVLLAAQRFGVGSTGFGALLGTIGLGATLGPLLFRRAIRPGDRYWLYGPYAVRGVVDLWLAAVSSPLLGGAALLVYGIATSVGMIAYQSTLQQQVPRELRGRVFALYDVLWNAARLLSLGMGGLLADSLGVQMVYVVGGCLLLGAAAVGWAPSPPERQTQKES